MDRTHGSDADFRLGGFSLWVHRWQFDPVEIDWDEQWLDVTARFDSTISSVVVGGPILRRGEIESFLVDLEELYRALDGAINFCSLDPGFEISIRAAKSGTFIMTTELKSDHVSVGLLDESHTYRHIIDQSCFPSVIEDLYGILSRFPKYERTGRRD